MYQYTFSFVLTKWQKSIQIIFYGILSDTKQYLLHLRIEKNIHILTFTVRLISV